MCYRRREGGGRQTDRQRQRQADRQTDRQTGRDKDRDRETDQPTVRVSGLLMTSADVYYSTSVTDIPTHPVTHQRPGQYNNKQIGFTGFKPKTTNTTTTSHRHMDKKQNKKKPAKYKAIIMHEIQFHHNHNIK